MKVLLKLHGYVWKAFTVCAGIFPSINDFKNNNDSEKPSQSMIFQNAMKIKKFNK